MLRRKFARAIPETLIHCVYTAFSLDCFRYKSTNRVVKFSFEVGHIVETHEFDARNERLEGFAILRRVGNGQRTKCSAVKRIFQSENSCFLSGGFPTAMLLLCIRVCTRELQRSIDSFGTAVGEKHTIEAGPIGELSRERALVGVVEKI